MGLGREKEALVLLKLLNNQESLPLLYRAALTQDASERSHCLQLARENFALKVRFPNTLDDIAVLQRLPQYGFAQYLLGCFFYSKRSYARAESCWLFALRQLPDLLRYTACWGFMRLTSRAIWIKPQSISSARWTLSLKIHVCCLNSAICKTNGGSNRTAPATVGRSP